MEFTEVETSSEGRPSVHAWFAEVVIIVPHLAPKGLLEAFAHQIRLVTEGKACLLRVPRS